MNSVETGSGYLWPNIPVRWIFDLHSGSVSFLLFHLSQNRIEKKNFQGSRFEERFYMKLIVMRLLCGAPRGPHYPLSPARNDGCELRYKVIDSFISFDVDLWAFACTFLLDLISGQ